MEYIDCQLLMSFVMSKTGQLQMYADSAEDLSINGIRGRYVTRRVDAVNLDLVHLFQVYITCV